MIYRYKNAGVDRRYILDDIAVEEEDVPFIHVDSPKASLHYKGGMCLRYMCSQGI